MNVPGHHILCLARRNQAAQHKPAVLCLVAAVVQHQRAVIGHNRYARQRILRRQSDLTSARERKRLRTSVGLLFHRPVRMPRENV